MAVGGKEICICCWFEILFQEIRAVHKTMKIFSLPKDKIYMYTLISLLSLQQLPTQYNPRKNISSLNFRKCDGKSFHTKLSFLGRVA